MPRIRFTASPKLPRDLAHLGYVAGTEVDLSDDQASRWLRRGVAEIVASRPRAPRRAEAPAVVADPPADPPPPAAATPEPPALP